MNKRLGVSCIAAVALGALTSAALAQTACGTSTSARAGETLAELAARCDVSVAELREANPGIEGDTLAAGTTIAMPAAAAESGETDLIGRARELLRDAGTEIERAARDAGQSVSDYLSGNPDIGRDLRDLGESYGLPGFGGGTGAGVEVTVTTPLPAAGEEVTVTATGLRPNAAAEIGIGPSRTDYEIVEKATADDGGRLETTFALPDWITASERVVFVVDTENVTVRSDPIEVASE